MVLSSIHVSVRIGGAGMVGAAAARTGVTAELFAPPFFLTGKPAVEDPEPRRLPDDRPQGDAGSGGVRLSQCLGVRCHGIFLSFVLAIPDVTAPSPPYWPPTPNAPVLKPDAPFVVGCSAADRPVPDPPTRLAVAGCVAGCVGVGLVLGRIIHQCMRQSNLFCIHCARYGMIRTRRR